MDHFINGDNADGGVFTLLLFSLSLMLKNLKCDFLNILEPMKRIVVCVIQIENEDEEYD